MTELKADVTESIERLYRDGIPDSLIAKRLKIAFRDVRRVTGSLDPVPIPQKANIPSKKPKKEWPRDGFSSKIEQNKYITLTKAYSERLSADSVGDVGYPVKSIDTKNGGRLVVDFHRSDGTLHTADIERDFRYILEKCSKILDVDLNVEVSYNSPILSIKPKNIQARALLDVYKSILEREIVKPEDILLD